MNDHDLLEDSIQAFNATAINFALESISDVRVRRDYITSIQQVSRELREAVSRGELTPRAAAQRAQDLRNQVMQIARLRTSYLGRALAEAKKAAGRPLNYLIEKYSAQLYRRPFLSLGQAERNRVFLEIVEAAGRDSVPDTLEVIKRGRLGRGILVVSLAIVFYNIASAENKWAAAREEGMILGGGILGGAAGGAAAGLVCGPGAPVCVTIGAFIGGVAGALGADFAHDWFVR